MAGNERKDNYRRPYRNPRYKGHSENTLETTEEVKIPRRAAHIERTTSETDIQLSIDLDGSGESDIDTGIGFFDHMLKSFAKHGLFDLTLRVKGDLIVDLCAIDLSGRPYLVFDAAFHADSVGYFDTQMVKEFFYAVSYSAGMNLHIRELSGENDHHIIEGMFKAFAKALDEACQKDDRIKSVLSTKGSL